MAANSNADTDATTAGAAAAEHRQSGQDAHTVHDAQFDSRDARVADFDKDTGTDERYEVESGDRSTIGWLNAKRTYDWHQSLDSDALIDKRKHQAKLDSLEVQAAEQRLQHQGKMNSMEIHEREQARRHYEDMHTMRYGVAGEMVEAIANRTADYVWARCPWKGDK